MAQSMVHEHTANRSLTGKEGKYLTFELAGEQYGIDIRQIKEIIDRQSITPVPRTPAFVRGVINLRGQVIPVTDLRLRFALEGGPITDKSCIVVVEIVAASETLLIGLLVDRVCEVLYIRVEQIEDPPSFGARVDTSYIRGMAKSENRVIILIDIERVLDSDEIQMAVAA